MMSTDSKNHQFKTKFDSIYANTNHKPLTTLEAIHEIFEGKKSLKQLKITLISIGKEQNYINEFHWSKIQAKQQFFQLCQQLAIHFDSERDQSMKSLSEMNQQLFKMKKSLSQKKIFLELQDMQQKALVDINIQNQQQEKKQNVNAQKIVHAISNESQKFDKQINIQHKRQNQSQYNFPSNGGQTKQESTDQTKIAASAQIVDKEFKQRQNSDTSSKSSRSNKSKSIQNSSTAKQQHKAQEQSHKDHPKISNEHKKIQDFQQKEQKIKEPEKQNKLHQSSKNHSEIQLDQLKPNSEHSPQNSEKDIKINNQYKDKHQQTNQKYEKQQKGNEKKNLRKIEQHTVQVHSQEKITQKQNTQKNYKILNPKLSIEQLERRQKQHMQKMKLKREQQQWTQIYPKEKQSGSKKLDTLPQMENQFYEEMKNSQAVQQTKHVSKYNPHLQLKKKQMKNKRQPLPQPHNQLQLQYNKLKLKLIDLFSFYIKQLKTNNFTFDAYPQSLDLKTFLMYFKHFKLAKICKPSQIPKFFKKYAVNGAWLNQDGFMMIHLKILNLSDDYNIQFEKIIDEKQKINKQYQNFKQSPVSKDTQKQRIAKEKDLNQKKLQAEQKYTDLFSKLGQINELVSSEEVKKVLRKANKVIKSIDSPLEEYDPDRLKKIVQSHSGIYKQDIIDKLNERKLQKQKRHNLQVHRILEKYKAPNDESSHANSSGTFKQKQRSNQSTPNLRKIEGYARLNNMKKHGNIISIKNNLSQNKRMKSETKVQSHVSYLSANQQNTQAINDKNQPKVEIYKELSLPKLSKRKLRDQSIYQTLNMIDTKTEVEKIKNLISEGKNKFTKEDEKIFNQYFSKQKQMLQKQKTAKKANIQNRMKFT